MNSTVEWILPWVYLEVYRSARDLSRRPSRVDMVLGAVSRITANKEVKSYIPLYTTLDTVLLGNRGPLKPYPTSITVSQNSTRSGCRNIWQYGRALRSCTYHIQTLEVSSPGARQIRLPLTDIQVTGSCLHDSVCIRAFSRKGRK